MKKNKTEELGQIIIKANGSKDRLYEIIYNCDGPYEYVEYEEDEDDDWYDDEEEDNDDEYI